MVNIQIREIQPQDNQQIATVIRQVFEGDDYPKVGTAYADKQLDCMFETYNKPKAIYFVVLLNDEIVGGGGIGALENADESICELQKMYFLPEVRGKGIGLELINKCLEKATEFGFYNCYLETLPEMKTAQHIYKKVGFDYLTDFMGNTGHTTCSVQMIKNLQ